MREAQTPSAPGSPFTETGEAPLVRSRPGEETFAIRTADLSKRYTIEKPGGGAPHLALLEPLARLFRRGAGSARRSREFWALDGFTCDIGRGERVGVVGRNGAGKTTLLKILSRIVVPTRGEARIRGRVTSLLEVGTGFNNALTGRENVFVNASMHGLSKRQTAERFESILEFSGIDPGFIDTRVKHYSSGMRVRLAFSVAAHLDPDIMLLDEVLAVGDMAFQERCLERVEGMMKENRTVLFVSHDMSAVTRFCERAIWLEQGRLVMDGPAREVVTAYSEQTRKAVTHISWMREPPPAAPANPPAAERGTDTPEMGADEPARPAQVLPDASPPARGGPDPAGAAPGNGIAVGPDGIIDEPPGASLVSVRLIGGEGRELQAANVDQKLGIEFVYDVLRNGKIILPAARFYTADDILMFIAVYTDPDFMQRPKEAGRYISVLWVPPHLLNCGPIHVAVSLTTPVSGNLERHVVIERALAFEVHEAPFGVRSARGPYRKVKGAVRPLLDWETRRV